MELCEGFPFSLSLFFCESFSSLGFLFYFILISKKDTIYLVVFSYFSPVCFLCPNYYSKLAFLTFILTMSHFFVFSLFPLCLFNYTYIGLYLHVTKCPLLDCFILFILLISVCKKIYGGRQAEMLF